MPVVFLKVIYTPIENLENGHTRNETRGSIQMVINVNVQQILFAPF